MNEKQKLRVIYEAVWAAKEIIRQLDTAPCGIVRYSDFQTPELRDMFYDLNDMNCKLTEMMEGKK